jgi:hypothetical protein
MQGGLQQPIQQHSWDVTFASARPNNTIFGLHPQASGVELGMFFPEEPELMEQGVIQSKGSYGNENKWIGGSQFESIHQDGAALLARYDIPDGWRFPHVDIYLPKTLDTIVRNANTWIICRMEDALVGIRPLSPPEWIEESGNWRIRLRGRETGYAVETALLRETSLEEFERQLRALPPPRMFPGTFVYTSRAGKDMRVVAGSGALALTPSPDEMLFDGRHIRSRRGSGVIELHALGQTRTLDFARLVTR